MPFYDILPVPAPRMTQSDKWKKRPCVLRYFAFRDEVRLKGVQVPNESLVVFQLPMPESWSKKKKEAMCGKYHMQKSDVDNLLKGLLDAVYDDDAHISNLHLIKIWSDTAGIYVESLRDNVSRVIVENIMRNNS